MKSREDEISNLIKIDDSDRKRLAATIEEKNNAILPEWGKIEAEIELIGAKIEGFQHCFSRDGDQELINLRLKELEQQSAVKFKQRDDLTQSINAEISSLKTNIYLRHSVLVDALASWCLETASKLPDDNPIGIQLREAREQVLAMRDGSLEPILNLLTQTLEAFENADTDFPVIRFGRLVTNALAVGA